MILIILHLATRIKTEAVPPHWSLWKKRHIESEAWTAYLNQKQRSHLVCPGLYRWDLSFFVI